MIPNSPPMTIIGIDPSTSTQKSATGIIVPTFDWRGNVIAVHGCKEFTAPKFIELQSKDACTRTCLRIAWTRNSMDEWIENNITELKCDFGPYQTFFVNAVAMESGFHKGNDATQRLDWSRGAYLSMPSLGIVRRIVVHNKTAKNLHGSAYSKSVVAKETGIEWANAHLSAFLSRAAITEGIADAFSVARAAWGMLQLEDSANAYAAKVKAARNLPK